MYFKRAAWRKWNDTDTKNIKKILGCFAAKKNRTKTDVISLLGNVFLVDLDHQKDTYAEGNLLRMSGDPKRHTFKIPA